MSTALLAQESASNFPILPCLIAVPAAGAVVVAFLGKRRPDLIKLVALLFSLTRER